MEIMRKFIINLKSDGTVKWAGVVENQNKDSLKSAYNSALSDVSK